MNSKECSKCGETLDLDNFRKNKRYKGGHVTWCKPCEKSYQKEHYRMNRAKKAEHQKEYAKKNAEKIAARKARYYQENKERIDARNKAWADANPEKRKSHVAKFLSENPDAWREHYESNKEKYAASVRKRQAAKLKRTPSWANEQAIRAFYEEAKRLERETGVKYHVDHIIPLQGDLVSGLHVESNLQVIPASQNLSKSNKYEAA